MGRASQLAKAVAGLLAVLAGAVAILWAVDEAALYAAGPSERTFATVAELERAARARLALPTYFPATLRWPPSLIRLAGHRPAVAVLGFSPREGGPERLFVSQAVSGDGPLPPEPGAGVVLESRELSVAGAPALLERLKGEDGALWHRLSWSWNGRAYAMRSRGSLEELLRMAETVRREGG